MPTPLTVSEPLILGLFLIHRVSFDIQSITTQRHKSTSSFGDISVGTSQAVGSGPINFNSNKFKLSYLSIKLTHSHINFNTLM